jgi:hypothetical protein
MLKREVLHPRSWFLEVVAVWVALGSLGYTVLS